MNVRAGISNCVLVVVVSVACAGVSGCNAIMGALMAPDGTPEVRGHWDGRVERVVVFDGHGKAHDALALEILDGPTMAEMRSSWEGYGPVHVSQARGGGTRPLLSRWPAGEWCRLIDPSSIEVGQMVRLGGRMTLASPDLAREVEGTNGRVSRAASSGHPDAEHVIIIEGAVKVVR
jgi:hypothetical protein